VISPDGLYLATAKRNSRFEIWRLPDLAFVREIAPPDTLDVSAVAYSPDSQFLAAAGGQDNALIVNDYTGQIDWIGAAPDDRTFVTASGGTIMFWGVK